MNAMLNQVGTAGNALHNIVRIALVGAMGIGKSTAIRAVCGSTMVESDVPNLDKQQHQKEMTTVGVEFGQVDLGEGAKLEVYGCPGQDRFDFVRTWVLSLSQGAFVMVDVNRADAVDHACGLLDDIAASPSGCMAVILCARDADADAINAFAAAVEQRRSEVTPILQADVRERQQMLDVLQVLVSMLTFRTAS